MEDQAGCLVSGLTGYQHGLAEPYISFGSLYMCSLAFLPRGLPPEAPFWRQPEIAGTSSRAWAGIDLRADHALRASPPRFLP
jgi:hypothetical protein